MEEAKQAAEAFQQDIAAVTAAVESEEGPLDAILQEGVAGDGEAAATGVDGRVLDLHVGPTDDALKQEQAVSVEHEPSEVGAPLNAHDDIVSTAKQVQGSERERSDEIETRDAGKVGVNSASILELVGGRGVSGDSELQPAPLPPKLCEAVPPSHALQSVDFVSPVEQTVQVSEPERSDEIAAGDVGIVGVNALEDPRSGGDDDVSAEVVAHAGSAAQKASSTEPPPSPRRSYSSRSSPSLRLPGRAPRTPRAPAMARTATQKPNSNDASQMFSWQPLAVRLGPAHHSNWTENGSPTRAIASQHSPRFESSRTDGTTSQVDTLVSKFLARCSACTL